MTPEQIRQLVVDAANFAPGRVIATALHLSGLSYGQVHEILDPNNERDPDLSYMKLDTLTHLRIIVQSGRTPELEKPANELMAMILIRECSIESYGRTLEIVAKTSDEARRIQDYLT